MRLPADALAALAGMSDAEVEAVVVGLPDAVVLALVPDLFPPEVVALALVVKARRGALPDEP